MVIPITYNLLWSDAVWVVREVPFMRLQKHRKQLLHWSKRPRRASALLSITFFLILSKIILQSRRKKLDLFVRVVKPHQNYMFSHRFGHESRAWSFSAGGVAVIPCGQEHDGWVQPSKNLIAICILRRKRLTTCNQQIYQFTIANLQVVGHPIHTDIWEETMLCYVLCKLDLCTFVDLMWWMAHRKDWC